jgi:ketosteroid isomerase-like protein
MARMASTPDLAAQIAALATRVQVLDDMLAVHGVLVSYGLAVDAGDAAATAALYAEDCEVDIDRAVVFRGRQEVHDMVLGDAHQAILGECAHVMGPYVVQVDGDHAVATGYATVYVRENGEIKPWRQAYGRFELARRDGTWQITKRVSRAVGSPDRSAVLGPPTT